MTPLILGVDMAKATFDLHILDHHKPKRSLTFPNTPEGFVAMLERLPDTQQVVLGVESTSTYHLRLATWAHQRGWEVFVLNPSRVHASTHTLSPTHKTDAIDSWLIAEFVRQKRHLLRAFEPESRASMLVRALNRERSSLVTQRTRILNKIEALPACLGELREHLEEMVEMLNAALAKLETKQAKAVEEDEKLSRQSGLLLGIPAVGKVLVATLLAEYGDLSQYDNAKVLTAKTGMVPLSKSSGTSVCRNGRMIRTGNAHVRRVLYMAAMSAFRSKAWKDWIDAKRPTKQGGKKLIMCVMDKILRLCFGVCKSMQPFDEKIAFST